MSSARLCLAGLLVASGLVLGAFTLHGYFDPRWEAKQSQAARPHVDSARAPAAAQPLPALQRRNRFVAREEKPPASPVRVTTATPSASPTKVAAPSPKDHKSVAPRKKVADKPKSPPEQQASFLWPWNLFNN